MLNILIFFKMHIPYRIKKLSIFDIGSTDSIIDYNLSRTTVQQIADSSYIPTLNLLLNLLEKLKGKFKFSISFSGVLLQQLMEFKPQVIDLLKKIIETKNVELICQPFYNSLSFLYNENEFIFEVNKQLNLIYSLFNYIPKTFANTELIYNNKIADSLRGFISIKNILTEPAEKVLGFKPAVYLYKAYGKNPQTILLRNNKLSDILSFQFNDKNFKDYPLTAEKYARLINEINDLYKKGKNLYCNLLFDMETFGYHYKENTGIFEFLYDLPSLTLKYGNENSKFCIPEETILDDNKELEVFSTKDYISMAGYEKNLSSFLGNDLQKNFQLSLYNLIEKAKEENFEDLLEELRKLSSVDYCYNMNENILSKFGSIYPSAETAYQNYLYALSDIEEKMG